MSGREYWPGTKTQSPQTTGIVVMQNWKLWQLSCSPGINTNLVLLNGIMVPFSGHVLSPGHDVLGLGEQESL